MTMTPDQLRAALFDAIAAHDDEKLAELCEQNAAVIVEHYQRWQSLPRELDKPGKREWYGDGMVALAKHFRDQRGAPELWLVLEAPVVIQQWHQAIEQAAKQLDACQYRDARQTIDRALELVARMPRDSADGFLPRTYSHLAACQWYLGDLPAGIETITRAAAAVQASGDDEALAVCLAGRYEMLRFQGDRTSTIAAADCLEQQAGALDRLGRPREAARCRRQAPVVRAGEPLCRAIAILDGEPFEISQITVPSSRVRFTYARNRISLPAMRKAIADGDAALRDHQLDDALAQFERAAAIDDHDPQPHFRAAYTHLHLRQFAQASAGYRATEQRAPGWNNCRLLGWLAEQLRAGAFDFDLAQRILKLQDPQLTGPLQGTIASAGNKIHELAIFHLAEGDALIKIGRQAHAEQAFRRGLELADEPDVRTQLLGALAAQLTGRTRERLLREAIELNGNLLAAARATIDLAQLVVKN